MIGTIALPSTRLARIISRVLEKYFGRIPKRTPKEALLARSDFAITNPAYLQVGEGTYFGKKITISTPAASQLPNTLVQFSDESIVSDGAQLAILPGSKLILGESSKIGVNCIVLGDVRLSNYSSLGPNVYVSSGKLVISKPHTYWLWRDHLSSTDDVPDGSQATVYIGEDCLIGANSFIRSGCYIGKGAIIGANSAVIRDVPPYSKQIGVPCREFEKRLNFEPPTEVLATQEEHWPYFYEGFRLKQTDLVESLKTQSIASRTESCLALAGGSHDVLEVEGILGEELNVLNLELSINNRIAKTFKINEKHFVIRFAAQQGMHTMGNRTHLPSVLRKYTMVSLKALATQSAVPFRIVRAGFTKA